MLSSWEKHHNRIAFNSVCRLYHSFSYVYQLFIGILQFFTFLVFAGELYTLWVCIYARLGRQQTINTSWASIAGRRAHEGGVARILPGQIREAATRQRRVPSICAALFSSALLAPFPERRQGAGNLAPFASFKLSSFPGTCALGCGGLRCDGPKVKSFASIVARLSRNIGVFNISPAQVNANLEGN